MASINRFNILLFLTASGMSPAALAQAELNPAPLRTRVITDTTFTADFSRGFSPVDQEEQASPGESGPFLTARCITDHQSIHSLRQSRALLQNDTLFLDFAGKYPFAGKMRIMLSADFFESKFYYDTVPYSGEKGSFRTIVQQLILDKRGYQPGDTLQGRVKVIFEEEFHKAGHGKISYPYYFVGTFRIVLSAKKED